MREFKDRTAVITGAASGIGLALAQRAAREGMRLVLADIDEAKLAEAARALPVPTAIHTSERKVMGKVVILPEA